MRRFAFAALVALLCPVPAFAQATFCPVRPVAVGGDYFYVLHNDTTWSRHTSRDLAQHEARRAASLHPGDTVRVIHDYDSRMVCPRAGAPPADTVPVPPPDTVPTPPPPPPPDTTPTPPPSGSLPAQLAAAVSWTSGTGTGTTAITDASRAVNFNQTWGPNGIRVVSDGGALFPSANHLVLPGGGGAIYMNGFWSAPGVGEHVTYRWLQRHDNTGSVNSNIYIPGTQNQYGAPVSIAEDALVEWQVSTRILANSRYAIDVRLYTFPGGVRTLAATETNFREGAATLGSATFPLSASVLRSLTGWHIEMVESFASGTHPHYPTSDIAGENFSSTAWSMHHFHGSGSGVYMRQCCLSVTRGPVSGREWPVRAWSSAEEGRSP
jgi:hypothetical protein